MRQSSWTDDATNNNSGSMSFPISHWELPESKTAEEDLWQQRLSNWTFFSKTLLEAGSEVQSSRSRDRDSLSSSGSLPSFSIDSDHSSLLSKQSSLDSSSSSTPSFKESTCSGKGDRYKTELCRPFEEYGSCKYGDKCQFAHGKDEIRVVVRHPKYKTDKCRTFYTTGFCPYGQRCHFVHDQQPMKTDSKVSKNTIGLTEQQMMLARQQQLRNTALLQQLQRQQQIQAQQQQQLAVSMAQAPSQSADQLLAALKRMLTISTATTSTDSAAAGLRPATLPIDDCRSQPVCVRPLSPVRNLWYASGGSTTASSPTKSLPSSYLSPSPSPTSPFELCDGNGYELPIPRWTVPVPVPRASSIVPSNIWTSRF